MTFARGLLICPEIIRSAVGRSLRSCLRFREVAELPCDCGGIVPHETLCQWGPYGQPEAHYFCRPRLGTPRPLSAQSTKCRETCWFPLSSAGA